MIVPVFLLFFALCIAGFVMGIVSLTKSASSPSLSPSASGMATTFTFSSDNSNGSTWTVPSGQSQVAGTFFVPSDGFLTDFSILGNAFSADADQPGNFFQWTASLWIASAGQNEFKVTGDGQNSVQFESAGYSSSTTFQMQSGTLKTYSGFHTNTNQLRVHAGDQFQVRVQVDYQVQEVNFADFIVSLKYIANA